MSPNAEPSSLDQLQSPEQISLLDAIDNLRAQGLSHHNISLPQLIVCGDQSSGKSSVLEGLTRLRFPTKDGLCTTFATELILRKRPVTEIHCCIVPGRGRSEAERDELKKFRREFASREEFAFPEVLGEARRRMEFGAEVGGGPFFEDVLQIRYSGPELPSLTIVDLPGIIQSQVGGERGVRLVRSLVQRYMADEKSIILAVVSARNDLENQGVLEYVKKHDPGATRTLGIITKPDTLDVGSKSEDRFVSLARNEVMPLNLGWHVVKNRGFGLADQSDTERDSSERLFFESGIWTSLSRSNVGIDSLRLKLSRVLLQHIRNGLPSLTSAITTAISSAETALKALGSPRYEPTQQRAFLMEKAQKFQTLTLDALRGLYNDAFFDVASLDAIPPSRLRTQVQDLNLGFASAMYAKGHRYHIVDGQVAHEQGAAHLLASNASHNYDALPDPTRIDLATFLDSHIGTQIRLSRPPGLPTLVNPCVIGAIFRQQAKPWEGIARQHLRDVYEAVRAYLEESLSSMMDGETFGAVMHELVGPELEVRWGRLEEKLKELLEPFQRMEPVTYDPGFVWEVRQVRARRYFESKTKFVFGGEDGVRDKNMGGMQMGSGNGTQLLTESVDDFTNVDILQLVQVYYKKSLPIFITNLTTLALESLLLTPLPTLLSPDLVLTMPDPLLYRIAAESDDIRAERAALTQKLIDLMAGRRILEGQARKGGKGSKYTTTTTPSTRTSPPPHGPTLPSTHRPSTPVHQPTPSEAQLRNPVDDLAATFSGISVTPPPPPPQPTQTPLTPPKSPKVTPRETAFTFTAESSTSGKRGVGKAGVAREWGPAGTGGGGAFETRVDGAAFGMFEGAGVGGRWKMRSATVEDGEDDE